MLLELEGLRVEVEVAGLPAPVIDGVSFHLDHGRTLALVGESGCGKSMTALAILRLLPAGVRQVGGSVRLEGRDLGRLAASELRAVRGRRMAMIFQEPMSALNPVVTIGEQVAEVVRTRVAGGPRAVRERVIELLRGVGIADPQRGAAAYPHQLSGGMRQRAMIAMALAGEPALLIADEPTTALDVTIQAQILALLRARQQAAGLGVLFITHDLGLVAQYADDVAVMYAGRIVEAGDVQSVLRNPRHPYTAALLRSVPRLDAAPPPSGAARTTPATGGSATPSSLGQRRPRLPVIPGEVPRPGRRPGGCAFHPRCERMADSAECRASVPPLATIHGGGAAACWKADFAEQRT